MALMLALAVDIFVSTMRDSIIAIYSDRGYIHLGQRTLGDIFYPKKGVKQPMSAKGSLSQFGNYLHK